MNEPVKAITLRLPAELHRRLAAIAEAHERSLNSELIVMLRAAAVDHYVVTIPRQS